MHRSIVAAKGRVQIDQEFGIKPSHLPLKYVRDGLALVIFKLPFTGRNWGTPVMKEYMLQYVIYELKLVVYTPYNVFLFFYAKL